MIWLTKYIRWIVLSSSILLSIGIYYYIDQHFTSASLKTIRLTQTFALTAVTYLYLALIHSPLYTIFPFLPLRPLWHKARRALGISAWYFAVLHATNAFFFQLGGFPGLVFLGNTYITPLILSLTALTILTAMAATSFDVVVRKLGKNWKRLHRLVYLAGILILIHALFLGTHFQDLSLTIPLILFSGVTLLLLLEGLRFDRYLQQHYPNLPKYTAVLPIWCIAIFSLIGYLYPPTSLNISSNSLNIHSQHKKIAEQLLQSSSATSSATVFIAPTRYTVSFITPEKPEPKKVSNLKFKVYDAANGLPITLFAKNYEKIAHVIIVDSSLKDFEHIHPTLQDGQLTVPFTFGKAGLYHIYLDFVPFGQQEQQFAFTLPVGNYESAEVPSLDSLPQTSQIEDIEITFSTDGSLRAKDLSLSKSTFKFNLRNKKTGSPITNVQPYLGAFGHLVMIRRDTYEYVHVHPTAATSPKPEDYSGPEIDFQPIGLYGPISPGPYILYAQFKQNDKIIVGRFSITVTP